jgi:hypothetical protein
MTTTESHELPMPGQVLLNITSFSDSEGIYSHNAERREPVVDVARANSITSRTVTSLLAPTAIHKPVLDIDFPATLVESSTPGHHHLYIDKELTWEQYTKLLEVMVEVGLLQRGYVDAAIARGYTTVRLPWVKKDGPSLSELMDNLMGKD